MKFIPALGAAAILTLAASGASADLIRTETGTYGPQSTDFGWSINLGTLAAPDPGYHITGIVLDVTSTVDVSNLTLTNNAAQNETFGLYAGTTVNIFTNSAGSDGVGDSDFLGIFSSGGNYTGSPHQTITLGPAGSGACADRSPSTACNVVSYAPGTLTVDDGAIAIGSSRWSQYLGGGIVTLTGDTAAYSAFNGGGNNIKLDVTETGAVTATLTYTEAANTTPDAPEPASMALMGSALAALAGMRFLQRSRA